MTNLRAESPEELREVLRGRLALAESHRAQLLDMLKKVIAADEKAVAELKSIGLPPPVGAQQITDALRRLVSKIEEEINAA